MNKVRLEVIKDADLKVYGYELLKCPPLNSSMDFLNVKLFSSLNLNGNLMYHINIGAQTLIKYADRISRILPRNFCLELIERDLPIYLINKIISKYEFPIVIDDFGSKSSNIDAILHLKKIHMVKFDRDFWKFFPETAKAFIKEIKCREIKVLAEKIETEEEFYICKDLGFEYFQGYMFRSENKEIEKK